jgi:hypothetical protein
VLPDVQGRGARQVSDMRRLPYPTFTHTVSKCCNLAHRQKLREKSKSDLCIEFVAE